MKRARAGAAGVRLASGEVLVIGGAAGEAPEASVEVYDPGSDVWSEVAPMAVARRGHTATLLPDGDVLVAGGSDASGPVASAERLVVEACPGYGAGGGGGGGAGGGGAGADGGVMKNASCAQGGAQAPGGAFGAGIFALGCLAIRRRRRGEVSAAPATAPGSRKE